MIQFSPENQSVSGLTFSSSCLSTLFLTLSSFCPNLHLFQCKVVRRFSFLGFPLRVGASMALLTDSSPSYIGYMHLMGTLPVVLRVTLSDAFPTDTSPIISPRTPPGSVTHHYLSYNRSSLSCQHCFPFDHITWPCKREEFCISAI